MTAAELALPALDERDAVILANRIVALERVDGPRVGDFVRFADGTLRRISYHWRDDAGWDGGCQTSDGGSWYLGDGFVSFSGALYSAIPTESLRRTDEQRQGSVWFFHHDYRTAGGGIDALIPFRVYECDGEAPR